MVQARTKHSLTRILTKREQLLGGGGIGGVHFENGSGGVWEISGDMEVISPYGAKKGETLYLVFILMANSKVKSTTLKSSDSKVVKIENVKQGKMKVVGKGTVNITVQVKWQHTGSADEISVADLKKGNEAGSYNVKPRKLKLKKGKTYSQQYMFTMKVK